MAEQTIPITLWLAGRDYRIRIAAKDEEAVRLAAKKATDKIQELHRNYEGKDEQDFLAMCLLLYATEQATGENSANIVDETALSEMEQAIDKALASSKK